MVAANNRAGEIKHKRKRIIQNKFLIAEGGLFGSLYLYHGIIWIGKIHHVVMHYENETRVIHIKHMVGRLTLSHIKDIYMIIE